MDIILISGFTGTNKKNVLFSVGNELNARDKKVCVVNIEAMKSSEKQPANPDSAITVREMKDVPCIFISDLAVELQQITKLSFFDYIVIEVPFSLPSGKVKKSLMDLKFKDLSFAPIIYVCNMNIFKTNADMIPKIVSTQIMESELVFANIDFTDQRTITALKNTFGKINPHAKIFLHGVDSKEDGISDFVDMILK